VLSAGLKWRFSEDTTGNITSSVKAGVMIFCEQETKSLRTKDLNHSTSIPSQGFGKFWHYLVGEERDQDSVFLP